MEQKVGTLVLVGTPLGNREDLSPRARRAILEADLLLCEDTRSPARLLGGEAKLPPRKSCFLGNEAKRVPLLLERLARGDTVAYVSEAGLPVWSDPGRLLVVAAIDAGHAVDVVVGPTAAAVALCHSGLPATDVRFVGFPPRGGTQRQALLDALRHESATVVLYEAGNRVPALLQDLARALADAGVRKVVVARELSKLHQEVVRGTVAELASRLQEELRGEVTVVLGGGPPPEADAEALAAREALDIVLDSGLKPREKAKRLAELTGLGARELYDRLLRTSEGT